MANERVLGLVGPDDGGRYGAKGNGGSRCLIVVHTDDGGDVDQGDGLSLAQSQLQEGAMLVRVQGRKPHGRHHLVGFHGGASHAQEELVKGQFPPAALLAGQDDGGVHGRQGRDGVPRGRGVGQIAGDGAPVAYLG
jgi:hypothetical protein